MSTGLPWGVARLAGQGFTEPERHKCHHRGNRVRGIRHTFRSDETKVWEGGQLGPEARLHDLDALALVRGPHFRLDGVRPADGRDDVICLLAGANFGDVDAFATGDEE